MYHAPLACSEGGENGDGEEGKKWRLPFLLYADDLVLSSESEEDLREIVGCLIEVCRSRGLKVNGDESKVGRRG